LPQKYLAAQLILNW